MTEYKIVGIDLGKTKFYIAAMNSKNEVVLKQSQPRDVFIKNIKDNFAPNQTFAFEACAGAHNLGQILKKNGFNVIALKPKDVKAYAKSKQKNDINDAIAICKAALDPELKQVQLKTIEEQGITFLHKTRQNIITSRIQKSNSVMSSLHEFGFAVQCGKTKFAKMSKEFVESAFNEGFINEEIKKELIKDCSEIDALLNREKELEQQIVSHNKQSDKAKLLETIPGIGPINASVLSIKSIESYDSSKDFSASLGIVPKQNTTGGNVQLGRITKQGDRYARCMLIQAARTVVMRTYKENVPDDLIYKFVEKLKTKGKKFNVISVAVANKLARIAYSCVIKKIPYSKTKPTAI